MLRQQEFLKLHDATLQVLKRVGIHIPNPKILSGLEGLGLEVDLDKQAVKFPPTLVEDAVSQVPKEIQLYYHSDPSNRYVTLGRETLFTPSGTGVGVFDLDSGQRRGSLAADVKGLIQIQDVLEQVDVVRPMVTAMDFGPNADLMEGYLAFRHSRKPFMHKTMTTHNAAALLKMGALVMGGEEELRRRPCFFVVYCPISPLSFSPEAVECMMTFAKAGIPVLVFSMTMGGGSAPSTLWGQVLVVNAEVLGGIALIQALYPRAPVLYGSVSSVLDMKTTVLPLGAPERGILNGICAELAQRYRIPSVMGGFSTDAKEFDEQAGFEKALTLLPLAGKACLVQSMGVMDSANTYSFEQLVLDDEMASAFRVIEKGVLPSTLEEELPLVCEMGWSGNYLTAEHTLRHCKDYWRPSLMTRDRFDIWAAKRKTLVERCRERIAEILKASPSSVLNPNLDLKLRDILSAQGISIPNEI